MKRLLVFVPLAVIASFAHAAPQGGGRGAEFPEWARSNWMFRRTQERPLLLAEANVVDVRTGAVHEGVHVLVRGDRIHSIGTAEPPPDAEIVDARDHWLVPGLFDLHAHVIPASPLYPAALGPEETMERLLDHGVTTIRCLPLTSELAHGWKAQVDTGELAGPHLVVSGPTFERVPQRTSFGFGDADTARAWVLREALLGSRWIKVYNAMTPEALAAIVETAHAHGMRVCGHTEEVPPAEASRIGMDCVEHMVSIPLSCMRAEDPAARPVSPRGGMGLLASTARRWELYDEARGLALMRLFRENGTSWVPTLVTTEQLIEGQGHDGVAETDEAVLASLREALAKSARLAVQAHRLGVQVGVGTDFPVDGVLPGASVHREMELLVELGGATPLEALQMATLASARVLGLEDVVGAVEEGMLADLVLLAANPLKRIGATRTIALVVHAGRVRRPR